MCQAEQWERGRREHNIGGEGGGGRRREKGAGLEERGV